MENKRRNAYDAAFKLKAISLRWDCESNNEETEVSDEVLRLFNSDTEEDYFDGFSAQEEDEEGDQWLFLVATVFFFFTSRVTGTVRKKKHLEYVFVYVTIRI